MLYCFVTLDIYLSKQDIFDRKSIGSIWKRPQKDRYSILSPLRSLHTVLLISFSLSAAMVSERCISHTLLRFPHNRFHLSSFKLCAQTPMYHWTWETLNLTIFPKRTKHAENWDLLLASLLSRSRIVKIRPTNDMCSDNTDSRKARVNTSFVES
jgi:hypothetical protein